MVCRMLLDTPGRMLSTRRRSIVPCNRRTVPIPPQSMPVVTTTFGIASPFSVTYDLPGRDGFGQMLKGWQVTSIVTLQTGLPWGAVDGFANGNDVSATGEFSDRWNFTGNPADFKAQPGGIPFVSPGDFAVSGTGVVSIVG